jgi:hypothetical protein
MRSIIAAATGVLLLSSAFVATHAEQSAQRKPAPRRTEPAVPFKVGETLTYDVSWSSFLIAGTAVATVVEKKPSMNSTAYALVADGRPVPIVARLYSLYYRAEALLDSFTLLSQQGSMRSEEGDRRATSTTKFDRAARKAIFERHADTDEKREFEIPSRTQDGLSALYALRAVDLRPGARLELPIANDGELFTVSIAVTGPEHVRVRYGEFDAVKLGLSVLDAKHEPVGQNMAVWLSTDARRLPLKLQADLPVGNFVLALKDVR